MTNPDNTIGTNAAYSGRTSANAFNDGLAAYNRGILTGWACSPSSGLTVSLGGDGTTRDVAIAVDNAGNKTTINNRLGTPVEVTVAAAPGSNSRIDAIVAYVDNPPQGTSTVADNPAACGIISVTGMVASSPTTPNDSQIRSAITADGASGTTAYYVILATVTVAAGTTDLTSDNITQGETATLQTILSGTVSIGVVPAYAGVNVQIDIPKQNNKNYRVLLTLRGGGGGYADVALTSASHSTTSFKVLAYNNSASDTTASMVADWLLIP